MSDDHFISDRLTSALREVAPPDATRHAALVAGAYLVLGLGYIQFSGQAVAAVARSVEELRQLESLKGYAFVAVTAAALFLGMRALLRRIERQYARIAHQLVAAHETDRALLVGHFASALSSDIDRAVATARGALAEVQGRASLYPGVYAELGRLKSALDEVAALNLRTFELSMRRLGGAPAPFDAAELLRSCLLLARTHRQLRECAVELRLPPGAMVWVGHEHLLRRALLNLMLNAAEAGGAGTRIVVALAVEDGALVLAVEDDGPGIPAADRERVLEPFFSTKQQGVGVGLASVTSCVEAHRGALAIGDSALGGARFELRLRPATAADAA